MSPEQHLSLFRKVLLETAKHYGIKPHEVVNYQYNYVSAGRAHITTLRYIGTFANLREFCFPSPSRPKQVDAGVAAIKRMLSNAKKTAA